MLTNEQCERIGDQVAKGQASQGRGPTGKGRPPTSWSIKPRTSMNLFQFVCSLDFCPPEVYEEKPADFDRGPVQRHPIWKENMFIVPCAFFPLVVHSLAYWAYPDVVWSPFSAWVFYHLCFVLFAVANLQRLHFFMTKYGELDENIRARDMVDDKHVDHLGASVLMYTILRTAAPFMITYKPSVMPLLDISIWTLPKIMLWDIALDGFFFFYHSACHRFDALWFIHRAHHGTKHPTAILSLLADDYQEVIELILIPLAASWCVPLKFGEAYIAIIYLLYVEMMGHSGIRAYWPHPLLTPILKPLDCELIIEDHDLHHRSGRGGLNYGKQTRIFDRLAGSVGIRQEATGF